jgi:hypothetical protein
MNFVIKFPRIPNELVVSLLCKPFQARVTKCFSYNLQEGSSSAKAIAYLYPKEGLFLWKIWVLLLDFLFKFIVIQCLIIKTCASYSFSGCCVIVLSIRKL